MKPQILYEDNHLLVVIKPFNVPVQADASGDLDLLTFYKAYIKQTYHKPGDVYLGLVHRLDRPTGGVIVFAKTSKAAARLSKQLQQHRMQKTYLLRCVRPPKPLDGTMEDFLLKGSDQMVRVVRKTEKGAKQAILHYQTLRSLPDGSAVCKVQLETGRSHQIRVQFASRGCVLLGDARYGTGGRQLCLWAYQLTLIHPTKQESMVFTAPAPKQIEGKP